MPVLAQEEILLPEELLEEVAENNEEKKPVICVLDPIGLHATILGFVLGELLDRVEIFWVASFSRTFIGMNGINESLSPHLIAEKKPVLFISELEVIPGEYSYGVEMLQNIRAEESLKNIPLVVISNKACFARATGESADDLKKLGIIWTFTWDYLERSTVEQDRLFNIVFKILGPG